MASQQQFTATTFRRVPGAAGRSAGSGPMDVVALRARPRAAGSAGEWAIWETFAVTGPVSRPGLVGSPLFGHLANLPTELTAEQVAEVATAFSARLPDYEFEIVRASLVVDQAAAV